MIIPDHAVEHLRAKIAEYEQAVASSATIEGDVIAAGVVGYLGALLGHADPVAAAPTGVGRGDEGTSVGASGERSWCTQRPGDMCSRFGWPLPESGSMASSSTAETSAPRPAMEQKPQQSQQRR